MPWRKCTCRPTRGGRVDPGCGDPDRRTGGIRLRVMARRRGAVFRPSVSSHTRTLAHMLAPLYDGTDFRPSRNGDGVAPAATHRLRECGRAMTRRRGQFADLRYPFTPTLAHKLARSVDETDFRPSGNGDGAAPAGACSLRVCESAMARRRGKFSDLRYPVTPMLARMLARAVDGRSTRRTLVHREAVMGRCPRQHKVCESVGERRCDVSGSLVTFSFRLHRRLHTS